MANQDKFSSPEWGSAQNADPDISDQEGFFDPGAPEEDDLWFLPGPDDARLDAPHDLPGPKADHTPLVDIAGWQVAQGALATPLANLAVLQGRLMERLAQVGVMGSGIGRSVGSRPGGWWQRLALQEVADLSWLAGDRVPMERLSLWMALRLTGDADDAQECVRAGWAVRRLTEGPGPKDDLAVFLGRHEPDAQESLAHKIGDWQEVMGQATDLHPLTRAALSFHIWPILGLSEGHALGGAAPLPLMEAAVVSARLSMQTGSGGRAFGADGPGASIADGPAAGRHFKPGPGPSTGSYFLPLALGGAGGLRAGGTAEDRLQRWLAGATHATRAALRRLDEIRIWEHRATETCAALTGRTAPQLITLLRDWPLVSAQMAQAQLDASRAAIQRNLAWMAGKGLIREVTGQGRYRFWTIAG